MSETPNNYFSESYDESRARFLNAAEAAGATITSKPHAESGPAGEALAMDFATLGPADADKALVVISGTHGPEGLCGSGCQAGLLESPELRELTQNIRVVLVHAHNPYGFAWWRRTNEDNIDLNRNYVDFSEPLPTNEAYDLLKEAFNPRVLGDPAAAEALKTYEAENGKVALMAAMLAGQRSHPDGIFYGGKEESWSNRTIRSELPKQVGGAEHVMVIDVHTGLGPFGEAYLVHGYPPEDPRHALMLEAFEGDMRSTAENQFDEDMPVDPKGPIVLAMDSILPGKDEFAYVVEYGTKPDDIVLGALRADNWLHSYGDLDSEQGRKIKADMRDAFYPDSDEWRQMIWSKFCWSVQCSVRLLELRASKQTTAA